jgi:hypothetical protein
MSLLIYVLIVLLVFGAIFYVYNRYIALDAGLKNIGYLILFILFVIVLLGILGLIPGIPLRPLI